MSVKYEAAGAGLGAIGNLNKAVFGALLSAILAILFMISRYIPVLGVIAVFFCPVPIVLMHVRHRDPKYTFLVALVSSTLIGIFSGPLSAFAFFVTIGLQGVSLGFTMASGRSAGFSIVFCAVVILLSTIALMFTTERVMDANISVKKQFETLGDAVVKMKADAVDSLKKSGATEDQVKQMEQLYDQSAVFFRGMHVFFPMLLFGSALMSALINYRAALEVLGRLRYEAPPIPEFATWRLSWVHLWGLIAGLLLVNYFDEKSPGLAGYLNLAGKNINIAFFFAFFINGLAVTHHYFRKHSVNMALRVFLYAIIMLHPLFNSFVLVTGAVDPWLDVRGLEAGKKGGDDRTDRPDDPSDDSSNDEGGQDQ